LRRWIQFSGALLMKLTNSLAIIVHGVTSPVTPWGPGVLKEPSKRSGGSRSGWPARRRRSPSGVSTEWASGTFSTSASSSRTSFKAIDLPAGVTHEHHKMLGRLGRGRGGATHGG
jgi:hypothetical protein